MNLSSYRWVAGTQRAEAFLKRHTPPTARILASLVPAQQSPALSVILSDAEALSLFEKANHGLNPTKSIRIINQL